MPISQVASSKTGAATKQRFWSALVVAFGLLSTMDVVRAAPVVSVSAPGSKRPAEATPLDWLRAANYAELDRYFSQRQRDFEAGALSDEDLYQNFSRLNDDSLIDARNFDDWVSAFPASYVARCARGAYFYHMASSVRGDRYASQTSQQQFAGAANWAVRAEAELEASLKMTQKPYLSTVYLLDVAMLRGNRGEVSYWFKTGLSIDPTNTHLRYRYMWTLRPRWGGSYAEMQQFLRQCEDQHLPAETLARLEELIHHDMAEGAMSENNTERTFQEWRKVLDLDALSGEEPSTDALIGYTRAAQDLHLETDAERGLEQLKGRELYDAWSLSRVAWAYVVAHREADAWPLLVRAANMDDAWAQFTVGKAIYMGQPALNRPPDHAGGVLWIRRSAAQCNADALAFLRAQGLSNSYGCGGESHTVGVDRTNLLRWTLVGLLLVLASVRFVSHRRRQN